MASVVSFSLSPVDVDDAVLIDKLEDVGSVHEDADGADGGDQEEKPKLGSVHHHRHVFPVLADLKRNVSRNCKPLGGISPLRPVYRKNAFSNVHSKMTFDYLTICLTVCLIG